MIKNIIKLANDFDSRGKTYIADGLDKIIASIVDRTDGTLSLKDMVEIENTAYGDVSQMEQEDIEGMEDETLSSLQEEDKGDLHERLEDIYDLNHGGSFEIFGSNKLYMVVAINESEFYILDIARKNASESALDMSMYGEVMNLLEQMMTSLAENNIKRIKFEARHSVPEEGIFGSYSIVRFLTRYLNKNFNDVAKTEGRPYNRDDGTYSDIVISLGSVKNSEQNDSPQEGRRGIRDRIKGRIFR